MKSGLKTIVSFSTVLILAACSGSGGSSSTAATTISPGVSATFPALDAVNIPTASTLLAGFDVALTAESVNPETFLVYKTTDGPSVLVPGSVNYDSILRVAIFTPSAPLNESTEYTVSLESNIMTVAGKPLDPPYSWNFTTREEIPPTVLSTDPTEGQGGVSFTAPITIHFSEALDPASLTVKTVSIEGAFNLTLSSAPAAPLAGAIQYVEGSTDVVFQPTDALLAGKNYKLTITGVKDIAQNAMSSAFTLNFTALVPLSASLATPIDGASNIATNTTISVTFSNPLNPTTVTSNTFTISGVSTVVPINFSNDNTTATFTPGANLAPSTNYTVTLDGSVASASGLTLGSATSFSFTTGTNPAAWGVATTLEPNITSSDSTSYQIAQGANGDTFAVWLKSGVVYANRMPAGGNWDATPQVINQTSDGTVVLSPAVAVDGSGNALVAWAQGTPANPPNNKTYTLKYIAGTGWENPSQRIKISTSTAVGQVKIAMLPTGNAIIIWRNQITGNPGLKFHVHGCLFNPGNTFASGTFSNDLDIQSTELHDADNLQVAMSVDPQAGNPIGIAMWTQINSFETPSKRVYFRHYSSAYPSGSGWMLPIGSLDTDSANVVSGSLRAKMDAGGNVFATWAQGTPGNIYATRYKRSSTSWSTTTLLENQANNAEFPALAINLGLNGDAIVVWQQSDNGFPLANNIYYNKYTAASDSWLPSRTKITSYNPFQVGLASIAVLNNSGNAIAVWREQTVNTIPVWQVYASKFNAATNSWSATSNLCSDNVNSADLTSAIAPQIIATPNHEAAVLWSQKTATNFKLWANIYR